MKWVYALFGIKHVHCFSDKKHDYTAPNGSRIITMSCNKCGKEQLHVYKWGKENI